MRVVNNKVPAIVCNERLVDASFADDCEIVNILKAHDVGRPLKEWQINHKNPQYIDTTEFPHSVEGAFDFVERKSAEFYDLPSAVREYFHNDIRRFAQFAEGATSQDVLNLVSYIQSTDNKVEQPNSKPSIGTPNITSKTIEEDK